MVTEEPLVFTLDDLRCEEISLAGGKAASLSVLLRNLRLAGVPSLNGFVVTTASYRRFLCKNGLVEQLKGIFSGFDPEDPDQGPARAKEARDAILAGNIDPELQDVITRAHRTLLMESAGAAVAVRSSGTEDLPSAPFAGQYQTFLNITTEEDVIKAVQQCFASLYTARAVSSRAQAGFSQTGIGIAVIVQPLVRSDRASAGAIFTLDPESGFREAVVVTGSVGFGPSVMQGSVNPDEWVLFKPNLGTPLVPIIGRRLGTKERMVVAGSSGTEDKQTEPDVANRFCLADEDVARLAQWAVLIEKHYSSIEENDVSMVIEWAKDGSTGEMYILQARVETVHSRKTPQSPFTHRLLERPSRYVVSGQAVGERVAVGPAKIVRDPAEMDLVESGVVLIAETTDPDWEPVLRRVAAIVTNQGGRTAHAAIVSRELGVPCIVGTIDATECLTNGQVVTVSCAEGETGYVYDGPVDYAVEVIDDTELPDVPVELMVNIGDPAIAFSLADLPADGVGLARTEFIIASSIRVHPMALCHFADMDEQIQEQIRAIIGEEEPEEFFVQTLSEGVARIAAAFHPRPVIVRTSDFKTNEYARLIGGHVFEPMEENPMLGFRGASRYYDARYADGFALECAALLRARKDIGLTNIKIMIPFCRTLAEGKQVIEMMAQNGLRQGEDGLEVYAMCELPSNVILADQFLAIFDGYSIGSNDLTQLTLGIDRDSATVAHLFDERDEAVKTMITQAVAAAKRRGKAIGICGQGPSDFPDFACWLVEQGITSLSLNPDTLVQTRRNLVLG